METFSELMALCAGNSPVNSPQRPGTRGFDVFFDLFLNKRLSKQSSGWLFEMPLHPLWRYCYESSYFISGFSFTVAIIKFDTFQQRVVVVGVVGT